MTLATTRSSLTLAALLAAAGSAHSGPMCGHTDHEALRYSPACFPQDMSGAEMQDALKQFNLLPPTQSFALPGQRFEIDTIVWHGAAGLGVSGQALPASLTFSFPADGVHWGLSTIHAPSVGANELNARFANHYGDVDRGREFVRQSLAAWSTRSGLAFTEVADDNSPMDDLEFHLPQRGDLRIGGAPASGAGFLGYNAFPSATGLTAVGGGDMFINTSFFNIIHFNNPNDTYRYFRNTVTHELGHGLGLFHVVPCTQTKLMEPQVATGFDGPSADEIRGVTRNYGDRYAPNYSFADAHDLGDMTVPFVRSFADRNLSLNGSSGPNGSDNDWFRFRLTSPQQVAIVAAPAGGVYDTGPQTASGCTGAPMTIDAMRAGDIQIELMNLVTGAGQVVNHNPPGFVETLVEPMLPAGDYAIRIADVGPSSNQLVQLYDLSVLVGTAAPNPVASAGVDKRCEGGVPCWFIGHLNSYATDPNGASIVGYEWDLDGDGVYDHFGPPELPFVYPSSGSYAVSLRVIDSNGMAGEDQINVTVHDAQTVLSAISPASAYRGQTVTVQVSGANFLIPTSATLSGTGTTATGLIAQDALGTLAETTITIDANAAPGVRAFRVHNADGADTLAGAFTILVCTGDANGDLTVDFTDLNIVLSQFGQTGASLAGDLNDDGVVDFTDLNALLSAFGNTCP